MIVGLRDSWVREQLPVGLQQLRDAVLAHPQLERSWTKFAAYRGLGTWLEVTNAEAAEFQSSCATVLEDPQRLPEPWWMVSLRWLESSPMILAAVFSQNSKSCIFSTAISNCTQ